MVNKSESCDEKIYLLGLGNVLYKVSCPICKKTYECNVDCKSHVCHSCTSFAKRYKYSLGKMKKYRNKKMDMVLKRWGKEIDEGFHVPIEKK